MLSTFSIYFETFLVLHLYNKYITTIFTSSNNKDMTRFNEVTEKLNKMFKGTEEQKDDLVLKLKTWVSKNRNTEDKEKIDAINCFLADKGIV